MSPHSHEQGYGHKSIQEFDPVDGTQRRRDDKLVGMVTAIKDVMKRARQSSGSSRMGVFVMMKHPHVP